MEITTPKHVLRKNLRTLSREVLTDDMRSRGARNICEQLLADPHFARAQSVGLYAALHDEPSLDHILLNMHSDKKFFLPRVEGPECINFYPFEGVDMLSRSSSFGIQEPTAGISETVDPMSLDLIVVPALAYDSYGYRLGRGKGYYDRYLALTDAYRIGVTFGLQKIASLPVDPWDKKMHIVYYAF
ncbi:5-formyltetrahydrofolate cyclo-ligase [Porphyromonas pogonae]|uniref:5-formyltetrahydrofolate cyclo-ligase n=1 Tax=Porphyromonas pogonae TaxID=867595 RepID=UPI002E779FC3|nr:5-formyltetrahydrofolate cyclo-ligase [Porphyromonas pogonae]